MPMPQAPGARWFACRTSSCAKMVVMVTGREAQRWRAETRVRTGFAAAGIWPTVAARTKTRLQKALNLGPPLPAHRCALAKGKEKWQIKFLKKKGSKKTQINRLPLETKSTWVVGCRVHPRSNHLATPSSSSHPPSPFPAYPCNHGALHRPYYRASYRLGHMCAEVAGICVDGCLQTCRESCRCIACPCSACARDYDASGEEAQPILTRSQPAPTQQPAWSSVQTLRDQQHG